MERIDRSLVRVDELGYEVWRELTAMPNWHVTVLHEGADGEGTDEVERALRDAGGSVVESLSCYTPGGDYVGTEKVARRLYGMGVVPEKMDPGANVCSVGFCEREGKWYGWSHRAMYGFGVGDVVSEGDCTASSGWTEEYLAEHPEKDLSLPVGFVAESLEGARRMAVAFAESVG